jgi:nucleoside-diphosphate-sugar epimerase
MKEKVPGKTALVFGASGVTGWAFVNELLNDYPAKGIWDSVYALTNRPLTAKAAMWPDDPRLHLVSGVDLLEGNQQDLESKLKSQVQGIKEVTHVYYLGQS